MRKFGVLVLLGGLLSCAPSVEAGVDPLSQVAFPMGKLLFDLSFADLEASRDVTGLEKDVFARVHAVMTSRDFTYLPDKSSPDLFVYQKCGGFLGLTRYLVAFHLARTPEGVMLSVTKSEPIQLLPIDPGLLGRKPRSIRFMKPVFDEILALSRDAVFHDASADAPTQSERKTE